MIISSMLVFGTIGIFRKMIPMSSAWVAFFRGGIGSLFLLVFLWVRNRGRGLFKDISRENVIKLAVTGAIIGVNWLVLFEAYNYTSVSVATLCYYMQPTFVIILSCLILREKMTWMKAGCTAAAFVGMILVSGVLEQDGFAPGEMRGVIYGVVAAGMYAAEVIINKTIRGVDKYEKTFIQLAAAALVLVPYLILRDPVPTGLFEGNTIILLLIVGIFHTGFCYALYFGSMDGLRTQSVALLSYIDPVTALILSAVILGERLTPFGMIGAVLIIGSAIISELHTDE